MVSELFSSDIISTLLFVSPGFLTIALIGKFYGTTINMKQFEKTVWSLIASVPIGIIFFHINDINEIDLFLEYFISHPVSSLLEICIFSMILAISISLILKLAILEKISKKIIYRNASSIRVEHTVWDGFMEKNFKEPIIVRTHDLEYKGWLSANSTKEDKKEIVLDHPTIVYTDKDGNTEDFDCGMQIILFEDDIKSITVLEDKCNTNP